MPARLDPFVDVMLREHADQLYLLPDEPVTLVKDGKPRKVSKQPLTDQHIYALMVEVAPPEAADKIDQQSETEFDYAGANGLVRVRIVPEGGRLTAVISAIRRASQEHDMPTVAQPAAALPPPPPPPPPPMSRPSARALRRPHRRRRPPQPRNRRGPRSLPPRPWSTVLWRRPASCRVSLRPRSFRPPSKSWASCCARSSSRAAPICTSASASPRCSARTARSSGSRARPSASTISSCWCCRSCRSATAANGRRRAIPTSPTRSPDWRASG